MHIAHKRTHEYTTREAEKKWEKKEYVGVVYIVLTQMLSKCLRVVVCVCVLVNAALVMCFAHLIPGFLIARLQRVAINSL